MYSVGIRENLSGVGQNPSGVSRDPVRQHRRWDTLYALRRRASLTIPQLAEQLRYSPKHLYEVEGGRTPCGPVLNDRLAARFGYADPLELERTQPTVMPRTRSTRKPQLAAEVA